MTDLFNLHNLLTGPMHLRVTKATCTWPWTCGTQVFCYVTVKQVITGRVACWLAAFRSFGQFFMPNLNQVLALRNMILWHHATATVTADRFASPSTKSHLQANGMDCYRIVREVVCQTLPRGLTKQWPCCWGCRRTNQIQFPAWKKSCKALLIFLFPVGPSRFDQLFFHLCFLNPHLLHNIFEVFATDLWWSTPTSNLNIQGLNPAVIFTWRARALRKDITGLRSALKLVIHIHKAVVIPAWIWNGPPQKRPLHESNTGRRSHTLNQTLAHPLAQVWSHLHPTTSASKWKPANNRKQSA